MCVPEAGKLIGCALEKDAVKDFSAIEWRPCERTSGNTVHLIVDDLAHCRTVEHMHDITNSLGSYPV